MFSLALISLSLTCQQPVLDVKPYIPYCDSIQGATVPQWLMVFISMLLQRSKTLILFLRYQSKWTCRELTHLPLYDYYILVSKSIVDMEI